MTTNRLQTTTIVFRKLARTLANDAFTEVAKIHIFVNNLFTVAFRAKIFSLQMTTNRLQSTTIVQVNVTSVCILWSWRTHIDYWISRLSFALEMLIFSLQMTTNRLQTTTIGFEVLAFTLVNGASSLVLKSMFLWFYRKRLLSEPKSFHYKWLQIDYKRLQSFPQS